MRLEQLPILLGIAAAVLGLGLVADGLIPDRSPRRTERRRRSRPTRNRPGEMVLGLGVLAVAAALIGRDSWRYTTLAMVVALVLFAVGLALNIKYVRGLMFGPAAGRTLRRRSADGAPRVGQPEQDRIEAR